jgi:hypothetical protein
MRKLLLTLVPLAGAAALAGCVDDKYGAYPYDYGYGGVGYSAAWGDPYWGWYGDYYYPGTGYYVYDSYRRPYAMTTTQRQYWSSRSPALRTTSTTRTTMKPNWGAFNQRQTARADRQTARADRQAARSERQTTRRERRRNND